MDSKSYSEVQSRNDHTLVWKIDILVPNADGIVSGSLPDANAGAMRSNNARLQDHHRAVFANRPRLDYKIALDPAQS